MAFEIPLYKPGNHSGHTILLTQLMFELTTGPYEKSEQCRLRTSLYKD